METKVCSVCKRALPFDRFGPDKRNKTYGLRCECKDCRKDYYNLHRDKLNEQHRAYRINNPELYGAYRIKAIHRYFVIKHKQILHLGGECRICHLKYNIDNQYMFAFHHLNPEEKDKTVSDYKDFEASLVEVNKCELLCHNCHSGLHATNNEMCVRDLKEQLLVDLK